MKTRNKGWEKFSRIVSEILRKAPGSLCAVAATTVMGKETNFKDVMENGDVLLIMHPTTCLPPDPLCSTHW